MVLKIGHRGACSYEPENTILSFKKAIELKVDFIELDIRKTKDGMLVVIHDEKVDRTTNGKGFVKDYTFDKIRKLDAGKGERIPTPEEVIDLAEGKCGLVIELKEAYTEKEIVKIIKEKRIAKKVIIVSFYPQFLQNVKNFSQEIKTGIVTRKIPDDYLRIAKNLNVEYVLIRKDKIKKEYVDNLHKLGLKVAAWTVDNKKYLKKMLDFGVDAIASNKPDILNF